MADLNDMDLVREYADHNSELAFAELVRRHLNLVYSVALRWADNASDAQDVTQAVFVILAKKSTGLRQRTTLTGWLYDTTRFTARQLLRTRARRQAREQEAYMQSTLNNPETDGVWRQLAPHLETAMSRLNAKERTLLALRFYENKTGAEAAALLGIREEAAHKRTARALEKLHRFFTKRGVSSTTAILAGAISTNAMQVAPVGLAKSVTLVAMTKGVAASGSTLTLIKGALKIMAWTKMKTIVGIGILLVAGTGAVVVKNTYFPSEPSYQGRRLSEWLVDVDYGQPQEKRTKAGEAIRQMGVKTLPFLLADLGDKQGNDNRCRQATWAFDALGPIGKSAIPKLTKLLEQNPGYVPGALAGIGRDALPELMNALTNGSFWVRDNAGTYLANAILAGKITSQDASAAFPVAMNNLTYSDTNVMYQCNTRSRAAWLLAALRQSPDVSIPALIQGLQDSNANVAADCAFALMEFGKQARPAIPALTMALNSTNSHLNSQAKMALDVIERQQ